MKYPVFYLYYHIIRLLVFATMGLIFFANTANAQSADTNLLYETMKIVNYNQPIVYIKSMSSFKNSIYIDKINFGKFYETETDSISINPNTGEEIAFVRDIDSLILTDKEKKWIIEELGQTTEWENNLFTQSILVNDISEGFKEIENFKNNPNCTPIKGYKYVFTFSKPIYIRNETISLVCISAMCGGSCGINDISFYRKKDGKWEKWIKIGGGIF